MEKKNFGLLENKRGNAIGIKNVIGTIWACFTALIIFYIGNPIYDMVFGLVWDNLFLKYTMEILFMMFFFIVAFVLPFQKFTNYLDSKGGGN
jgi:hypothetical protein